MWSEEHADNIRGLEVALARAKAAGRASMVTALESGLAAEHAGEPPQDAAMAICLRAWGDLNTCRSIGMSIGPIPVTAIFQWCAVEGFDREATGIVREVIRQADNAFMEKQASRQRMNRMTGGQ